MPPRKKPKRRWLDIAKEWQGLMIATVGIIGLLGTAVVFGGDLLHSDHPPLASRARVELLAQSLGQVQRQLAVSNFAILTLNRQSWQAQRDDAVGALAQNPHDKAARALLNSADLQLRLIDQQMKAAAQGH